jgi:hypothetical protein
MQGICARTTPHNYVERELIKVIDSIELGLGAALFVVPCATMDAVIAGFIPAFDRLPTSARLHLCRTATQALADIIAEIEAPGILKTEEAEQPARAVA